MCNKSLKTQLKECEYGDNIFDVTFITNRDNETERIRGLVIPSIIDEVKRRGHVQKAQVYQSKVFKSELIVYC